LEIGFSFEDIYLSAGHQVLHYHGSCNITDKLFFQNDPHSVPEIHFNATEGAIKLAFRCCWYICTIFLFLLIFNKWKLSIAYLGTLVWQYYTFSYTVIKKLPAYFLTEKYKVFMRYMSHAHTFPCVSAGFTLFIVNFKHWNAFGYFPIADTL
jgi:hypothetical protein